MKRPVIYPCIVAAALSPLSALAWTGTTDLISTSNCRLSNGRLLECAIQTRTVVGDLTETAVPLRSTVQVIQSGDCSTQFPLEVSYTFGAEPPVRHLYMRTAGAEVTLRRRDGGSIRSVDVADVSPWTKHLNVRGSCQISLNFAMDTPDVDSKDEAREIMVRLEAEVLAKHNQFENLKRLEQYQRAFWFLRTVADNFHAELTGELLQELRLGAEAALGSLMVVSSACDDQMGDDDRLNIMRLLMALPQPGSAGEWVKPDGSMKQLEDFMGPEARAIFLTVDKLARQAHSKLMPEYDAQLKQAAAEQVAIEHKVSLARTQLASWLD